MRLEKRYHGDRVRPDDLPEIDPAPYFGSDEAVAACLTDILEANDPALLASALGDIARPRGMSEIAKALDGKDVAAWWRSSRLRRYRGRISIHRNVRRSA